ncbi:MAG: glycosyltransferase [Nitriliruptorales bacterium]|nr:glycosyltransferase [Nitriliruptorales bacterium]
MRIALLAYRGDPFCGGQGVYIRNLSRELLALGHDVEVFAGQPYPVVDNGVVLTPLPSLDLYRQPDPFRVPSWSEFRDPIDLLEFGIMCSAGFPEPLTFSLRAARMLRARTSDFDVVHDNQTLGYGILDIARRLPVVETIHHPITVDRRTELSSAVGRKRLSVHRWYGFATMQRRVARRLAHTITVSRSSAADIVRDFGLPPGRLRIVPVGIDPELFRPLPGVAVVRGRIVTTASADVPMKGLGVLLEAVAKLRVDHDVELVVVGKRRRGGSTDRALSRLGLTDVVRFVSGIDDKALVALLKSAQVAVVPSLYEGFSLPAVEAMACATPLVATTGGALPEVVGTDRDTALLVEPNDPSALAGAIGELLDHPALAERVGAAGRARVLRRFTWRSAALQTAEVYRAAIAARYGHEDGTAC